MTDLLLNALACGVAGAVIAAALAVLFRNRVAISAAVGFVAGALMQGPLLVLQLWLGAP